MEAARWLNLVVAIRCGNIIICILAGKLVIACTEINKTKKIEILRAVHVVELSWAFIVIIFSFKSLHLGCHALP